MKSLLLMRHGKSDWSADFDSDHDRPLNQRGIRSARLIGRLMKSRSLIPDIVVSSTALRARTTAELAIDAGRWDSDLVLEEALYSSGVEGVLSSARDHRGADLVMMVGHEPTWSVLVEELTTREVEMKTGSVAVVELSGEPEPGSGELIDLIVPRDYFGSSFDA